MNIVKSGLFAVLCVCLGFGVQIGAMENESNIPSLTLADHECVGLYLQVAGNNTGAGTIRVWDAKTDKCIKCPKVFMMQAVGCKIIFGAGAVIKVCGMKTKKDIITLTDCKDTELCIQVTPNGSAGGKIDIWDMGLEERICTVYGAWDKKIKIWASCDSLQNELTGTRKREELCDCEFDLLYEKGNNTVAPKKQSGQVAHKIHLDQLVKQICAGTNTGESILLYWSINGLNSALTCNKNNDTENSMDKLKEIRTSPEQFTWKSSCYSSEEMQKRLRLGKDCVATLTKTLHISNAELKPYVQLLKEFGQRFGAQMETQKFKTVDAAIHCGKDVLATLLQNETYANIKYERLLAIAKHIGFDYFEQVLKTK